MASDERIPEKLYFRIGEASRIVGVKPYVLRFWEKEFDLVKPEKSSSKQRLYRRQDVVALCEIKRLLHEERYTIEGTRKKLKELLTAKVTARPETISLDRLKSELLAVRALLKKQYSSKKE
ncbi:MAG: MerR family transcriptional regulator [Deltaproteobacteria bacterium]|nr:MerR family transcriptional regulator [Deltaproteobacteria bacterium]